MEKKYQVFVSSTYKDLQEERQFVLQTLIRNNCIPVAMEYFEAANDDQLTVIKELIDHCDYYILIIGGLYGSIEPHSGKSYTQLEYEYALEQKIPVAAFLYQNPEILPVLKSETDPINQQLLANFIALVKNKLCNFWNDKKELGLNVTLSLQQLIKHNPRSGWVKADAISSEDAYARIKQLTEENTILKKRLKVLSDTISDDTARFRQGEDKVTIHCRCESYFFTEGELKDYTEDFTWNQIFLFVAMLLMRPANELEIVHTLEKNIVGENSPYCIDDADIKKILIQLMALNLIVSDTVKCDGVYVYWTLSDYGKKYMAQLAAEKK